MIAGVCGGLASYFDIDTVLIRLLWVLTVFAGGTGLLLYFVAWIIIPEESNVDRESINIKEREPEEGSIKSIEFPGKKGYKIVGPLVIIIGVLLLITQFMPSFPWENVWPIMIILVGIAILLSGFSGKDNE